jgi:NAD(P)-dependent dehydrogenase (short-subunit alcohol dehydrogenase family)
MGHHTVVDDDGGTRHGPELRFDGQVAVVTGAGGGLGRAYALLLAARGARVVVNDLGGARDGTGAPTDLAHAVVDEIIAAGGEAVADLDSVTDPAAAQRLVARAVDTWGRLDVVVNNAGITGKGSLADPDVYERVVATHLFGTVNVLRAAWPHLLAQQGGARVVNTASGSFFGVPGAGDYAAAKGGVLALTRSLACDTRRTGIHINAVMPVAYTRMTAAVPSRTFTEWMERWFQPDKVAAFVAVLCHESVPCTGETFVVGGGRAARVLFQTTRGHMEDQPTPESFRDAFDEVMAGQDARVQSDANDDLLRYAELLPDPGPFA